MIWLSAPRVPVDASGVGSIDESYRNFSVSAIARKLIRAETPNARGKEALAIYPGRRAFMQAT
jgi:hypothetical protein